MNRSISRDDEYDYEREAAQDEYDEKIRSEYKDELIEEILTERGEEYTVWVAVSSPDIQSQIGEVARCLAKLVATIEGDNQLPDQPDILSDMERKQLVAVLEAALCELKAPFVDRGRFKILGTAIAKLFQKSVEKEATSALQTGLKAAGSAVTSFLKTTKEASDFSDLF